MNDKSLVKFQHDNEKGLMHYVIYNGDVVVLSEYESKKVDYIEKNGFMDITFDVKSSSFSSTKVEVVTDKKYVKAVYDYMIETNNSYFTEGYDSLCVIKFEKHK